MLEKDRISYFYDGTFTALPVLLSSLTIRCKTLALAIVATLLLFGVAPRAQLRFLALMKGYYGDRVVCFFFFSFFLFWKSSSSLLLFR